MIVNNSLIYLDISYNNLGPKSTKYFNKYLRKSNLQNLNIYENNINNNGISDLVLLFIYNPNFL